MFRFIYFFRYLRNASLRNDSKEERKRILNGRLEHQVFNSRSPDSPNVIMFHPYETYLAVAAKDSYGLVLLLELSIFKKSKISLTVT